jgi:hypothetical protein
MIDGGDVTELPAAVEVAWSLALPAPPEDAPYADRYAPLGVTAEHDPYTDAPDDLRQALSTGAAQGAAKIVERALACRLGLDRR